MNSLNSPKTTIERKNTIETKGYLKQVYKGFYEVFLKNSTRLPIGKKVEIGSGAGFIKDVIPNVLTSDIMRLPFTDLTFTAENMPFKNNSVAVFYMLNTFHHIKDPNKALSEFSRCLTRNGKIIMIEPANTPLSKTVYKYFHHEDFDENGSWKINSKGNLSGSNQAMSYIIFKRDRSKFSKLFKNLKIVKYENHTPFNYLLSGGFSYPSLLPTLTYKYVAWVEKVLSPLINTIGLFTTIVIKKV